MIGAGREQSNPLDGMSWEERFREAFLALLAMESRAERAERELIKRGMGKSHDQVAAELKSLEYTAAPRISGKRVFEKS